jgi:glutamyl-tRNA reductase
MLQLIGVRHDIKLDIREKLSIIPKRCEDFMLKILDFCEEVVILSTCNRTEVYINCQQEGEPIIDKIFDTLIWDKDLKPYIFYNKKDDVVRHLMNVVCGLDSIIVGEDQILSQVKKSYEQALDIKGVKKELQRLFQSAITCGKEFRYKSKLYTIPVSTASIAANEARKREIKRFMILGYGDVGTLASKYILSDSCDILYVAARDVNSVDINDNRVKIIPFADRRKYYKDVECIISCTSAPHCVITAEDLPKKQLLIFDLAVPRDVGEDVYLLNNIEVYNIDKVSAVNDENHQKRKHMIEGNRFIIDRYVKDYLEWLRLRELTPYITRLKTKGEIICKNGSLTFKNKKDTKDNLELAEMLLRSTSNAYVNRAIEVLKSEHLEGRGEECLRVIKKIFL